MSTLIIQVDQYDILTCSITLKFRFVAMNEKELINADPSTSLPLSPSIYVSEPCPVLVQILHRHRGTLLRPKLEVVW